MPQLASSMEVGAMGWREWLNCLSMFHHNSHSISINNFFKSLEIRKVIYETAISKPDQRIEIIGIKTIWTNRRWRRYLNGMGNKGGWDGQEHVRLIEFWARVCFGWKQPQFENDEPGKGKWQVILYWTKLYFFNSNDLKLHKCYITHYIVAYFYNKAR